VLLWASAFPAISVAVAGLGAAGLAVARLGVASVTLALVATAPVYASLLAVGWLGERAGRRRWTGSAIALAGTALIAVSHGIGFGVSALLVLAAAVLQAVFHTAQKPLLRSLPGAGGPSWRAG